MRNTIIITIGPTDIGVRDRGKSYYLEEMPSVRGEKWALKAIFALQNAGIDVPVGAGMEGIFVVGVGGLMKLQFAEFEPLMDEMMECVSYCPERNPDLARPLVDTDIEELTTRLRLRAEVLLLHVGFLPAEAKLRLTSAMNRLGLPLSSTSQGA